MPHRLRAHYPGKPNSPSLQTAYLIICNAHKAASSFLKQFEDIRRLRLAKGTPTDGEQDLLRAMLSFACAGLDAMVKQLVRDALAMVIARDEGATAMFVQRTRKTIYRDGVLNAELLTQAIVHGSPRDVLVDDLKRELTANSLQSVDELLRVAAYFNIPSRDIVKEPRDLKAVFDARNQIAHEMDIDFDQPNRHRYPRARDDMIAHTNRVLLLAKTFLEMVENKLA